MTDALLDTWTCHVCKRTRPDARIYVATRTVDKERVTLRHNLRYCNDDLGCATAADEWLETPNPQNWHDGLKT